MATALLLPFDPAPGKGSGQSKRLGAETLRQLRAGVVSQGSKIGVELIESSFEIVTHTRHTANLGAELLDTGNHWLQRADRCRSGGSRKFVNLGSQCGDFVIDLGELRQCLLRSCGIRDATKRGCRARDYPASHW